MRARDAGSSYASDFIAAMELRPGESVLDVGSGAGTLALPLARAGHPVCALDFSRGMLDELERQASEEGLRNIVTVQASWDDDWRAAGVAAADVAAASRSLEVPDLRAALLKLDVFARRRVCVTLPADGMFYPDVLAWKSVGRRPKQRVDDAAAIDTLRGLGIAPEIRMITHDSSRGFESLAAARAFLLQTVAPRDEQEAAAMDRYIAAHLREAAADGGRAVWTHDEPIAVRWAFLAWGKESPR
jgi:SAM-dependent methyltransferase